MNISIKYILVGLSIALLLTSSSFSQKGDFAISSVSNVTTASYSVTVKANSFAKIMGWQGSIIWDNSKSTFAGVTNLSSTLSGIQFNNTVVGNTGRLSFLWIDSLLKAKTLPDSTVLFDVNFSTAVNASGVMNVMFSNIPTFLQASDSLGNNIANVAYNNGVVSFAYTNAPPSFTLQSINNFSGNSFQTNVTVNNFRQVLGMQGTIIWDSSLFSLSNVTNINATINLIGFNLSNKGRLLYLWLDSALTAQTLSDSAILFTLNFAVVNQNFTKSEIKFSSSYVPLQCIDANTNNIVGTSYLNGLIAKAGVIMPPTFYLKNISNPQGLQILQMPVSAKSFAGIASFQGSINWSSAKYQFTGLSNIHNKLNNISFNNSVVGDTAYLSYLWYDLNATLQTIPDDSVLFVINFASVCNGNGFDNIKFSNTPTQLLVTNLDSTLTGISYVDGWINSPSSVTPDITIQANSNIICANASVSIGSIVSNCGAAPTFIWKKNNLIINGANQSQIVLTGLNNLDSVIGLMVSNANCRTKDTVFSNKLFFKLLQPLEDTIVLNSCNSVFYNGITYTSSTSLKDTIKTASNCDSIYRTVNITIQAAVPINSSTFINGCDSVVYRNKFYYSSITLKDTLRTVDKCDSVYITVSINVSPGFKGNIIHPTKGYIKKVNAFLNSSSSLVDSSYKFSCLTAGSNGVVRLNKNNDVNKANGVTSVDVLLVQRHILNTTKLNSAYKIIAADVDGNKSVNSVDVLRMKRLILGTDTTYVSTLRGNRLWEFIDSSYQFPDTTNPFPFKDSISFSNLNSSKNNQTFIGLKLGDVNYDWNATLARSQVASRSVELVYQFPFFDSKSVTTNFSGTKISSSNNIVIPITTKNFNNIAALQFTLHFDNTLYEFVGIDNNNLNVNFNSSQANSTGNIAMLWTDKNAESITLEDGYELFNLVFKKIHNSLLTVPDLLAINNSITNIEAWDNDFIQHNVILSYNPKTQSESLNKNWSISPNPATDYVKVAISSKQIKTVSFELTDINGRTIFKQTKELQKGNNLVTINLRQKTNLSSGIYFLRAIGSDVDETSIITIR